MSKITKALSESFGIEIKPQEISNETNIVNVQAPLSIPIRQEEELTNDERDIEFARNKIYSLLNKGETAFDTLIDIAKEEESPRAFEVLNSMLTTLSDMSVRLIDIQEKKAKLKKTNADQNQQGGQPGSVTNNIAFVGTTADLQSLIIKKLNKDL